MNPGERRLSYKSIADAYQRTAGTIQKNNVQNRLIAGIRYIGSNTSFCKIVQWKSRHGPGITMPP